jgi:hypothetical protein
LELIQEEHTNAESATTGRRHAREEVSGFLRTRSSGVDPPATQGISWKGAHMDQLDPTRPPTGPEAKPRAPRKRLILVATVIALTAAAGIVAWLVIDSPDVTSSTPPPPPPTPPKPPIAAVRPVVLSATGLKTRAAVIGEPIYWAGPHPNTFYELTRTGDERVYVRYLPPGKKAGAPKGNYLIVATYPRPGAFAALQKSAHGREHEVPGGGIAVLGNAQPQSVHLAFPGVAYRLEIYHPSVKRALAVALSGDVRPVAG